MNELVAITGIIVGVIGILVTLIGISVAMKGAQPEQEQEKELPTCTVGNITAEEGATVNINCTVTQ